MALFPHCEDLGGNGNWVEKGIREGKDGRDQCQCSHKKVVKEEK